MSRSARDGVVMGISWRVVVSRRSRACTRRTRIPARRRPASRPTTVMSTSPSSDGISPQSIAADRPLTYAPVPTASVAATKPASGGNDKWPSA